MCLYVCVSVISPTPLKPNAHRLETLRDSRYYWQGCIWNFGWPSVCGQGHHSGQGQNEKNPKGPKLAETHRKLKITIANFSYKFGKT